MRFTALDLPGAWLIELERSTDERGFFARSFCEREFADHGLPTRFPQSNLSRNAKAGTLRGMHYAAAPHREAKLVRCVRGALHDVIVDLREASPARGRWIAVELQCRGGPGALHSGRLRSRFRNSRGRHRRPVPDGFPIPCRRCARVSLRRPAVRRALARRAPGDLGARPRLPALRLGTLRWLTGRQRAPARR